MIGCSTFVLIRLAPDPNHSLLLARLPQRTAYLQQEKPDDFVLATNETHTVREFVEKAFA